MREEMIFSAILFPHRSLGPVGLRNLALFCGGLGVVDLFFFWATHLWLVAIFYGIDLLLLYAAFVLNLRASRLKENVIVTTNKLKITRSYPNGRTACFEFNPFNVRFHVERQGEFGIVSMCVTDRSERVEIGQFLNPEDRESFSRAFQSALQRARGGI